MYFQKGQSFSLIAACKILVILQNLISYSLQAFQSYNGFFLFIFVYITYKKKHFEQTESVESEIYNLFSIGVSQLFFTSTEIIHERLLTESDTFNDNIYILIY